jgi:tetratricopeptide (TPR) repeat protein
MKNARIDQLKSFLAADPGDAQARFLLGYEYNKGRCYEDAIEVLLRCVEISPDYAAAWKQLGDALRKLDRLDEAVEAYKKGADAGRNVGNEHTARECETFVRRLSRKIQ